MRLYHGSNVEVRKPSLRIGRKNTDFGRGFYTTTQKEQAEHWTSIKMDRAKKGRRIVSVFEVDDSLLTNPELKIREFNGPDEAWLNFVVDSRKGVAHADDILYFADIINNLPRKILGYHTPEELFEQELDRIYAAA